MNSLFDKIAEWFKKALIGGITGNYQGMFEEVNTRVGEIASQVGQTPEGWNSSVFSMIKSLSDTVILPVAGMILTFVLCYELIQLIIEKNNMHDFDTWIFFKWIFKTFAATYILTHTFDIVMGVFDLAQRAINGSSRIISGSLNINLAIDSLQTQLESMEWYALMGLYMESSILSLCMKALSICIFLIVYGRMLEVYLTTSLASIPFATMVNREWGSMGQNYLKSLFAIAFQGFLIIVCIAIYAVLLNGTVFSANIHTAIWSVMGYTVLLCFSLFKTGSLSKSIFSAH